MPSGALWRLVGASLVLLAGCHLALGLEPAAELDSTSTSPDPDPECIADGECDDDNPCTDDRCAEGSCAHDNLDMFAPVDLQTQGDCKSAVCVQGVLQQLDEDDDVTVDGITCTDDICTAGIPSNPPLSGGTICETGVCNGAGQCVECMSNMQCTDPETCGGGGTSFECGCTPDTCAALLLTCGNAPNGCFGALNCDTSSKNGNETDVDCGGPSSTCPRRCGDGKVCSDPSDCASNVCTSGFCVGN